MILKPWLSVSKFEANWSGLLAHGLKHGRLVVGPHQVPIVGTIAQRVQESLVDE